VNRIILIINFHTIGDEAPVMGRDIAHGLAREVAKQILKELGLSKYSTAAAFSINFGDSVSLEIKDKELSNLLLENSLFEIYEDSKSAIDTALLKVFGLLKGANDSTAFGRSLIKALSSTTRDINIGVQIDNKNYLICLPKVEPALKSNADEVGFFVIESVFETKFKAHLICCKTRKELVATFDDESIRLELKQGNMQFSYVELFGTSIYIGGKKKKNSFVIKKCLRFFSDDEFAKIRADMKYINYFSENEINNDSLELLVTDL